MTEEVKYQPEPLRKCRLWEGTVKGTVTVKDVTTPVAVRVSVIADSFERAAMLVLDAGYLQATESTYPVGGLEVVQLEMKGFIYLTPLDVMEKKTIA